jgi:hypothetical protein
LKKRGIEPANLCSDEVFIRRVYLDVIGTVPDPADVDKFLKDRAPNKRAALIDALLARDEFADYWAMKWCDLLRVKAEFPINLWPNAVQAYHHWIRDCLRANKPYDQFVRELLTSSGSNFRVPPVNFYRAIQGREPSAIAGAVALTFMGSRIETWPAEERAHMAAFFSRIAYKQTGEWKEEIVCLDPAPAKPLDAVFPDGSSVHIRADQDPREVFANWLIRPRNEWFARNIANRAWAWFMGRGIINEPDDIRPDNPPVNPELLSYLERELTASKYDLKAVFRLILNSRTYQQSSIPRSGNTDDAVVFACYPVRRLDAEVLIDALGRIFGGGEGYQSAIPEPLSFIPDYRRTIDLADGSVTSEFLETFGRPPRDTGLESERNNQPSDAQRLHMLNSSHIQLRIERGWRTRRWIEMARRDRAGAIRLIYLNILSRHPTASELSAAEASFQGAGSDAAAAQPAAGARGGGRGPGFARARRRSFDGAGGGGNVNDAVNDLAWALVNSKEFLYRH